MSTWTSEDVDLPSGISELATALDVDVGHSAFTIAGSSSRPQDPNAEHDPRALTLERLLGARQPRTPSSSGEQLPVTRSGTRTRSQRAVLGMSWPNEGIEPRRRAEDVPWWNAVEMARRAGYGVEDGQNAGQSGASDAPPRDNPSGSRQETSATARAIRDRVRLSGTGSNRAPISLGPQQVVPTNAGYAWASYHGSSRQDPGERNQRMATTLLRRRRADDERRRDEERVTGAAPQPRDFSRVLDGTSTSRTHITYGFDPTDIEPPGGADDHIWDRLGTLESSSDEDEGEGEGEGDAGWGAFRGSAPIGEFPGSQAMLFDLFDVDGWGASSDVGAQLSRGRFNRRRQSMRGRDRESATRDEQERHDQFTIDFSPSARRSYRFSLSDRPSQLVRRRDPEEGSESDASMESSTPLKRRKRDVPLQTTDTTRPSYVILTNLPVTAELPTTFLPPVRSSDLSLTSFLTLAVEERKGVWRPVVTFRPRGKDRLTSDDADACSLHTTRPIPPGIGIHYFEVEVVNAAEHGHISIGWTKSDCHQRRLVGWDKGSWGWHADDGKTFEGSGDGRNFSEPWHTGDIVGCGIDLTIGRAFFTRNGKLLGYAFSKIPTGLYPAVGMRNLEESVAVNLTGPFEYDIDTHVRNLRDRVRAALLPRHEAFSDVAVDVPVPKLVGLPSSTPAPSSSSSSSGDASKMDAGLAEAEALLLMKLKAKLKGKGRPEPEPDAGLNPFADSPLRSGPSRAAAALVLDHLAVSGFAGAHALLTRDMRARGWLPSSSNSSSSCSSKPTASAELPTLTAPGSNATVADYATPAAGIRAAVNALVDGDVRWPLIRSLGDVGNLARRIEVYALAADAQMSAARGTVRSTVDDEGDSPMASSSEEEQDEEDLDLRVVTTGRELSRRARDEEWDAEDVELLGRAARQLVTPDDSLDADRRADASRLDRILRDVAGVQRHSCLHMAVAQTELVHEVLIERGDEEAAFMGVGAVLGDK